MTSTELQHAMKTPFRSISRFLAMVKPAKGKPVTYTVTASTKGAARRIIADAEGCPLRCIGGVSRLSVLHRCAPVSK